MSNQPELNTLLTELCEFVTPKSEEFPMVYLVHENDAGRVTQFCVKHNIDCVQQNDKFYFVAAGTDIVIDIIKEEHQNGM